ncbi:hypothetical protein [Archaeoglobus sp.]
MKHGGKIEVTTENCPFSKECAVCVFSNGEKCYEWNFIFLLLARPLPREGIHKGRWVGN